MSMYGELHKEFARRTRDNLRFIEAAEKRGDEVYIATQLINSLLGMVVFLKEGGLLDFISTKDFQEKVDCEILDDVEDSCAKPASFIRRFRNAITHCHIKEYGEPDSIEGLEIWDKPHHKPINWKVRINLINIGNLANLLVEHVLEERQP